MLNFNLDFFFFFGAAAGSSFFSASFFSFQNLSGFFQSFGMAFSLLEYHKGYCLIWQRITPRLITLRQGMYGGF
jgi:hypothetical protein